MISAYLTHLFRSSVFGLIILLMISGCGETNVKGMPTATHTIASAVSVASEASASPDAPTLDEPKSLINPGEEVMMTAPSSSTTDSAVRPAVEQLSDDASASLEMEIDTTYIDLEATPVVFSLSSAEHTTPQDVLREIGFTPRPGGGGSPPCDQFQAGKPFLYEDYTSELEYLGWHSTSYFALCGWQYDELVSIGLRLPNGELESLETQQAFYGTIEYRWLVPLNSPSGRYAIEFAGKSGEVVVPKEIGTPKGPQVFRLPKEKLLVLSGFRPFERVRLLAYVRGTTASELAGWMPYDVDERGQLIIHWTDDVDSHYIIGDISGEFWCWPINYLCSFQDPSRMR